MTILQKIYSASGIIFTIGGIIWGMSASNANIKTDIADYKENKPKIEAKFVAVDLRLNDLEKAPIEYATSIKYINQAISDINARDAKRLEDDRMQNLKEIAQKDQLIDLLKSARH